MLMPLGAPTLCIYCSRNSFVVIIALTTHIKAQAFFQKNSKRSGVDCTINDQRALLTIVVGNSIKNSFILHKYKLSLIMSLALLASLHRGAYLYISRT